MAVSYCGKKVLVLGLARSGVAAARLLRRAGALVMGADESSKIGVPDDLGDMPVSFGPFSEELITGCAEIVLSPGIPGDHPLIAAAGKGGIPVISELELGYRFCTGTIIAVTGTNGKSTTVSMIGAILAAAGYETAVAGNVGVPFCSRVGELHEGGVFVLEVSSFQLETITTFHPAVAGMLNLTPDHLDRYAGLDAYYSAKRRIIENCAGEDRFFYNARDARCTAIAGEFPGRRCPFSSAGPLEGGVFLDGERMVRMRDQVEECFMERGELAVAGLHNVENALAAVAACQAFDVPAASCRKALAGFRGLPHRMEEIGVIDGVTYFNDSKATNVEATVMSLTDLDRPAVLIAGGYDKGGDFTKLLPVLGRVRFVVTIGEAAPLIEEAIGTQVPYERAADMKAAVDIAGASAAPGEIVILSPACASFDMFDNFEHRGDEFRRCVQVYRERVR